eukprot:s2743_g2.t1
MSPVYPKEALQGWAVNVQFSVAMNIIRLLLLNHMIACAWWGFSHIGGKADGWSTQYGVEEEDRLYGYMTSLHWAIAQLGVGATGIEATNLPERIFSIFVALISLITFSTMVSSMTSMMTAYSRSKEEEARHFSLLQRYLLHNKVSTNLSQRITKFLQHAYMAQHKASSQDMHVPLLDMLSRALPFAELSASVPEHLLQVPMSHVHEGEDVIFCSGVEALAAYLPITGDVSYLQDGRQAEPCLHVWTAEMCLWTEWYFLGDLIATDVSRILMLDMESFCRAIASNPLMHGMAVQYAKEYTNNLRSEADGADISDTWQFEAEVEVHDFMFGRGFAHLAGTGFQHLRQTTCERKAGLANTIRFHAGHGEDAGGAGSDPGVRMPAQAPESHRSTSKLPWACAAVGLGMCCDQLIYESASAAPFARGAMLPLLEKHAVWKTVQVTCRSEIQDLLRSVVVRGKSAELVAPSLGLPGRS